MDKEIKRAKVINYAIAIIFLLMFISTVTILGVWKWNRTFTASKWMNNPNDRYVIVSDMLSKNELIGMTENEIIDLLGKESEKAPEIFKYPDGEYPDEQHLTYYLGGFLDVEWLIITIENGIATEYKIGIT